MSANRILPTLLLFPLAALAVTAFGQAPQAPKPKPEVQALIDAGNNSQLTWQERIPRFQLAVEAGNRLKDLYGETSALISEGQCYEAIGNRAKAVECYEKTITRFREAGNKHGEADALDSIGSNLYSFGFVTRALEKFQEELSIRIVIHDEFGRADALDAVGQSQNKLGKAPLALAAFDQALAIQRRINDKSGEASTLNNIGTVNEDTGHGQIALSFYEQALKVEVSINDLGDEASTLNNIGSVCDHLGLEKRALTNYNKALSMLRSSGDKQSEASVLTNIGTVYINMGQPQLAVDSLKIALPIREAFADRSGEAATLNNLGLAYWRLGQRQLALSDFKQVLGIEQVLGAVSPQSVVLHNIGLISADLGKKREALDYYSQALKVAKQVGNRVAEAQNLTTIGVTNFGLGKPEVALENFESALIVERGSENVRDEINTLQWLASLELRTSPSASIWFSKMAIRSAHLGRTEAAAVNASSNRSFAETLGPAYQILAGSLAAQKRIPELLEALALAKDDHVAGPLGQIPLTPREAQWANDFGEHLARLSSAHLKVDVAKKQSGLPATSVTGPEGAMKAEELAEASFRDYLGSVIEQGARLDPVQNSLSETAASRSMDAALDSLAKGTTAVFIVSGVNSVHILVLRKGYRAIKTLTAKDLSTKIGNFQDLLQDRAADPRKQGAELYKILIRPIERELSTNAVTMWSLSGSVRNLPISALWDGKRFLIEKYPSCCFSPAYISSLIAGPSTNRRALVLATASKLQAKDPITEELLDFPALHSADLEAKSVAKLLGTRPLLDRQFSVKALQAGLLAKPGIIHLASHFNYVPGDDRRSFLLTGDGGEWSVEAIKALPDQILSGVDLVTLSACATAFGSSATGEETESFGAWMQRKGAKAVISTLWPIEDESTAKLMAAFYTLRKKHPSWNKIRALRQAQLDLMHDGPKERDSSFRAASSKQRKMATASPPWPKGKSRYSHPYYWAVSFVLTGNWQ